MGNLSLRLCCAKFAGILLFVLMFGCTVSKSYATAWTTSVAGPVNTLANWTDGTTSPTTFATPGDTWTVTMAMTLPSAAVWTLGAVSSPPDTLTIATGGTISVGGIPTTPRINVYGVFMMTGGTLSMGGTAASEVVTVYGDVFISAGTINTPASSAHLYINTNGNFNMSGGTSTVNGSNASVTINTNGNFLMTGGSINTSAAGGHDTINVHGNFSMTGGTLVAGGAGCNFNTFVYGNFSTTGTSAMTNTGAGCTNTVHLALHRSLGNMMIDNTSTGAWSGTNIFVDTNCIAQLDGNFSTTTGSATNGVTVDGTLICPAAYTMNGTRMFTLNGVATLEVAHTTGINGAIVTTGTKTFATSANYVFNGTAAQVTGTYLPASLIAPDTILISNSAGVTLSQSTLTTGTLGFTSGILNTGAFTMSVPGAATSVYGAGATSYVNGTLIKTIAGLTTVNYEVGDLNYAPMLLTLSSAGTAGSLGLKTTNGLHPLVGTSGILSTNIANHYWTITNSGAAGPATVIPKATYNLVDIIGGSNASFYTQEHTTVWLGAALASTNTSSPYTSVPTTGIALGTLAGDYIFGNRDCGTAPITGGSTVCVGATLALSDATPGGTWASSAPAVATVSVGGVVTGVSAGVVTITYNVGACAMTTVVTVNPLPVAGTITGSASVCVGHTITLADAITGGTWSSSNTAIATVGTGGVVTGVTAGIVVISYTVTNSCGTATATFTVSVISIALCALNNNVTQGQQATELLVSPNPNTGVFTMNIVSPENEEVTVVINDMMGRTVKTITTTTNKATGILLNAPPGVYFLVARMGSEQYNAKVVVQ